MALVSVQSVRPHVRLITLDNPARLNSMSFALVTDLYAALEEVGADNSCRVVVLTGAGRAFCSGLELEHAGLPPGTEDLGRHRMGMRAMEYMGGIVPAMRSIPQPIVAAIKGPAYGGGMCLSLGADIRLAGRSAVFCGAGINNGLSGTELGVSWLLPRAVGTSNSAEILLTGKKVDAEEALRIGLVSPGGGRRRGGGRGRVHGRGDVRVQPVRPGPDQGHHLGLPGGRQPPRRRRPREPHPAAGRPHRQPHRGHRPPSRRSGPPVYTE